MTASLISAAAAMARFFPGETDLYDCFRVVLLDDEAAKVLLVEGDLALDAEGLQQTDELLPEMLATMGEKGRLIGIVVTGNLSAPRATLLEPDIDWSPRVKILGSLHVQSLCLGGSVFEVAGDLTADSTVFGYYNHGILRVGGRTKAAVILSSDYTMEFSGEVACPSVLADVHRLNIEAHFEDDALADILDPELIDSYNSPKEAEIIQRLGAGGSILQAPGEPRSTVSKAARDKLDALAARAEAGEAIVEIDLTDSELRSVPEEIRRYAGLRVLRLSKNNIKTLPAWIGDFAELEVLSLQSCRLKELPEALALHRRLRELDVSCNDLLDLPFGEGFFPALEKLHIGRGFDPEHVNFVANLDLAEFPRLRVLAQDFSGVPQLAFRARARLWNAPALEYFDFGAVFDERVPEGLVELQGLRGLACEIAPNAFKSALAVLPRLPRLELLTLMSNDGLSVKKLAQLRDALPQAHIRIRFYKPFEDNEADERHALDGRIWDHLQRNEFAEAATLGDRLFGLIDLERPDVSAGWLENAMHRRLWALSMLAHEEKDPARRRAAMERLLAFADRVLALLPRTPDLAWWADRRDLGRLRFECLLAKADSLIDEGAREKASHLLETASAEAERHLADHAIWLRECRERIARRHEMLGG